MNDQAANILSTNIKFKTTILGSDLCDYSDAYIVVKARITDKGTNDANVKTKEKHFQE